MKIGLCGRLIEYRGICCSVPGVVNRITSYSYEIRLCYARMNRVDFAVIVQPAYKSRDARTTAVEHSEIMVATTFQRLEQDTRLMTSKQISRKYDLSPF